MTDRITKTTIGDFDQVVALTQYLINQAFDNVWTAAHQDGDQEHDIPRRDGSAMNKVVLGAPKIIIVSKEGNRSLVNYVVHIKSGILKLFLSADSRDNSTINYQMEDWLFVFPVDIGLSALDPSSQKYKDVRAKMNKPGDYSIHQLLVDMQTAQFSIPDEKDSDFGVWSSNDYVTDSKGQKQIPPGFQLGKKRDWFSQPSNVQKTFTTFLQDLSDILLQNGMDDLGYTAVETNLPAGHDPTFKPTDVRFQTYPWIDPTTKAAAPVGLALPGPLNYLLYLEMTDNNTPPDPNAPNAFLPTNNGNWTDGVDPGKDSPSSFGSMVITGRNFLDKYFLPKLKKVNRTMVATVTKITPYIHQTHSIFAYEYSFSYGLSIGTGVPDVSFPDPSDDNYAFRKGSSSAWNQFSPLPSGTLEWIFQAEEPDKGWTDDSGTAGSKSYMYSGGKAINWMRLYIKPGTNQIVLEGLTTIHIGWEVNPSRLDPNFSKDLNVKTTWTITFTLQEVSDGGLIIKIDRHGPDVNIDGEVWDGSNDSQYVRNLYNSAGNNLDHLLNGLDNSLKGQERFYFPSKGTFFIKEPLFNHEGDLITGLEYNGVDDATHPNEGAESRDAATLVPTGQFQVLQPIEKSYQGSK